MHELNVWIKDKEHALNVHAVIGIDVSVNECSYLSGIHPRARKGPA
jgi:hypothetical protein